MKILITGGAGYIGSIASKRLIEEGYSVTIIDNFSSSTNKTIPRDVTFYEGDLLDKKFLDEIFRKSKFDGVIHLAAYSTVGESMGKPGLYFENNVKGSLNLLEAMNTTHVKNIIFSSTSGVYGNVKSIPIPEQQPSLPQNPYAQSKDMVERMLFWYKKIYNFNSVVLRYFNAAGATLDGMQGEAHRVETHIIPLSIAAAFHKTKFLLYGNDYPTHDGTCVRDYIHVLDLAQAHVVVLSALFKGKKLHSVYNIGTGKGYSNLEVLHMVKKVTSVDFPILVKARRPGDPNSLVADGTLIKKDLAFVPRYSGLQIIVETAWKWYKNSH